MSRSRRKTPIHANASADSDHCWKKLASRIARHRLNQALRSDPDSERYTGKRWEFVNPATSAKDGKSWFGKALPDLIRK